jgi:hypothetical protein
MLRLGLKKNKLFSAFNVIFVIVPLSEENFALAYEPIPLSIKLDTWRKMTKVGIYEELINTSDTDRQGLTVYWRTSYK